MEPNGIFHERLDIIEKSMEEIKTNLTGSINGLSYSVDNLSSKFENFINVAQNSIPVKAVFWLMGIMVLGLIGVEGVKSITPMLQFWLGIPTR